MRVLLGWTLVCVLALLATGCATVGPDVYPDAMAAWNRGDHQTALKLARKTYARYRDDNELREADVRKAADQAVETLEETPVVPNGEAPRTVPTPGELGKQPNALDAELRRELLGKAITPVMRALVIVRDMTLKVHAPAVFAVVFADRPLDADGGVLTRVSTALRTLAAKRLALDVLEKL